MHKVYILEKSQNVEGCITIALVRKLMGVTSTQFALYVMEIVATS